MAGVRDFARTCTQRCELSLPRENTAFRYGDIGPPFEYDIVRTLYLEQHKILLAD